MSAHTIRASLSASRKRREEAEKARKEKDSARLRGRAEGRREQREYFRSLVRTRHLPPPPPCRFAPDVPVVRVLVVPEPELRFDRLVPSMAAEMALIVEFRRKTMAFDAGNGRVVTWDQWEPCGRDVL